jgi:alpha-1,3-glucosyltransferase
MTNSTRKQRHLNLLILSFAILLRILVGIHPHSGQDDYQGPHPALLSAPTPPSTNASYAVVKNSALQKQKYGGDYEAQRHWMELTYHLPIYQWYYYDLNYWGLDYPPLTAYVSYFFGWVADSLGSNIDGLAVLKDLVALDTSRGFENERGKTYMRFTALIMDLLVYFSAVWVLVPRLIGADHTNHKKRIRLLIMALVQPAIVLIDHGHFQYNTVSLGLALWSFHFMTLHTNPFTRNSTAYSFSGPIVGSVMFSLALNFKQMELYHAPAVFAYLLGRCFAPNNGQSAENGVQNSASIKHVMTKFCALGITVLSTFALLWLPFAMKTQSNTLEFHFEGIAQVIRRLFPFQRGLFEGKVSNIWCALSVKPFSIRRRVPESYLPLMALGLTLMLILPPCWYLFSVGRGNIVFGTRQATKNADKSQHQRDDKERQDLKFILWGSAATALAFFLASFQVHEKGILIVLAPISMLLLEAPRFTVWFSVVATWTLWPLVAVDRLASPYFCCIVIYLCINTITSTPSNSNLDVLSIYPTKYIVHLSAAVMILLHIAELHIIPPPNLPDLFPVLWSVVGCGLFSFSYLAALWVMAKMTSRQSKQKVGDSGRVKKKRVPTVSIFGVAFFATVAALPTSDGFLAARSDEGRSSSQLSLANINGIFTPDVLKRAKEPLYWESQRAEDARPILDLSKKQPDVLALSDEAIVNKDKHTEDAIFDDSDEIGSLWEDGCIWLETERQLVSIGVLHNETTPEQPKAMSMSPEAMVNRAPQLIRLSTSDVIGSANFFLDEQLHLGGLIQYDPTILTYCVADLYYGLEYLSNMMTRGNQTLAIKMIQTQCSLSPQLALSLFKMGVDGGIDERRVSNALGNAAAASGKAVEYAVGDAGRSYREFKRLKNGKSSLG